MCVFVCVCMLTTRCIIGFGFGYLLNQIHYSERWKYEEFSIKVINEQYNIMLNSLIVMPSI